MGAAVLQRVNPGQTLFIGLDLTDPYAEQRRPCARATLNADLICSFDWWYYRCDGEGIVPATLRPDELVLAIDGPQGLAGHPSDTMRSGERRLNTAGRSPFVLPNPTKPYAGFIQGAVRLFYALSQNGFFHLYGLGDSVVPVNLIEVYPGAAWPIIAGKRLPPKRPLPGRQARWMVLLQKGIRTEDKHPETVPTHDQLDAAMAAYTAFLFASGRTVIIGRAPFVDSKSCVLREGFILQPLSEPGP